MDILNPYKICFLGRTGNGKTTLMNALYNVKFPTDPLLSCTKELYTVTKMSDEINNYDSITIYDTPGIGEFSSNDRYQKFYEEAVSKSNCIILVTTLDRTDSPSQRLLLSLSKYFKENVRFIVALNHIDATVVASDKSYSAWNEEENIPTNECLKNIEERISIIKERFNSILPIEDIVPVCGIRSYGIDDLRKQINNI